ncbi:DNA polymerase III subunit delta' [Rickettsiales bacterium]|nr:DNA polymerase III subunit delta' [Rickettsiales bacterium]
MKVKKDKEICVSVHPKDNPDLVGHDEIIGHIHNLFIADKMPQALLLSGVQGIGKATLAYRIAKFMLACTANNNKIDASLSKDLSVPVDHHTFRKILAGSHSDLMVIERGINPKTGKLSQDILVDDVRKIAKFFHMTSSETKHRIIIIDSADDMNRNAANAVLKVLEEPPADAILILISHSPGKLLPTIRSRCHNIKMQPLNVDKAQLVLAKIAPEIGENDAVKLLHLADGSAGKAIFLNENNALKIYDEIIKILCQPDNFDVLNKFCKEAAKAGDNKNWEISTQIIQWILAEFIRCKAANRSINNINGRENEAMENFFANNSVSNRIEIWNKACELFDKTDSLHLDKYAILISIFNQIKSKG